LCSQCSNDSTILGNGQANIANPPAAAIWNLALDPYPSPAGDFNIASPPLVVRLFGAETGQTVTILSNQGGLSGDVQVPSQICGPTDTCLAGELRATYSSLQVPTLPSALLQQISIAFADRAGNPAVPSAGRGSEIIYADVDVVAPAGMSPTVCIGESTTPAGLTPANDLRTYENPDFCKSACAASGECSRREGNATLVWQAPGASGGGFVPVSYLIMFAARGIPYTNVSGTTTYGQCSDLGAKSVQGPFEQIPISVLATAPPGGTETVAVTGLYPQRAYCFAVAAVDQVGNMGPIAGFATERVIPILDATAISVFNPSAPADDSGAAYYSGTSGDSYFGYAAVDVGDLDGDGRDDFAVTISVSSGKGDVRVFMSKVPALEILGPNTNSYFGAAIAGGDFDGDGHSDLAICAPQAYTTGANGGALYLYYGGVANSGIRNDAQSSDPTLPSINPDVALLGPAAEQFCWAATLANVHSSAAASDLVVGSASTVYGFYGGSRSRFPGTSPVKISLDVTATGSSNQADFMLQSGSTNVDFPWAVTAADVNGDGIKEVVVSDNLANGDAGQVYVYRGGSGLIGVIGAPATAPVQLMHTLAFSDFGKGYKNFGQNLLAVRHPLAPADTADWVLVQVVTGSQGQVLVFKGTSLGSAPGIVPAVYPLAQESDYVELDRTDWAGQPIANFGWAMGNVGVFTGHGSSDILIGSGRSGGDVVLFSFDATQSSWLKRAILQPAGSTSGFGYAVFGVGNYLGLPTTDVPQFAVVAAAANEIFLWH
jgi:hypothetical protein